MGKSSKSPHQRGNSLCSVRTFWQVHEMIATPNGGQACWEPKGIIALRSQSLRDDLAEHAWCERATCVKSDEMNGAFVVDVLCRLRRRRREGKPAGNGCVKRFRINLEELV